MIKLLFIITTLLLLTSSCSSDELESEMDEYCECLQKNIYNEWGRMDCLEMMDELKLKYKSDPRKLEKMLELSENCTF